MDKIICTFQKNNLSLLKIVNITLKNIFISKKINIFLWKYHLHFLILILYQNIFYKII